MKRLWYYPAWTMTRPFTVGLSQGGDELNRRTTCLHLGLLGVLVWAHEDEHWREWVEDAVNDKLLRDEKGGDHGNQQDGGIHSHP